MQTFEEVLCFKLRTKNNNNKKPTEKHIINSTYLVIASVGMGEAGGKKRHETD